LGLAVRIVEFRPVNLFTGELVEEANARHRGRIRPNDLADVHAVALRLLRRFGIRRLRLFFLSRDGSPGQEHHCQSDCRHQLRKRVGSDSVHGHLLAFPTAFRFKPLAWQERQKAMSLAWSLTSSPSLADACGWWQLRQLNWLVTFFGFVGSNVSVTGGFSTGCPDP